MWVTSYGDWGETDATENVGAFSRTLAGIIGGIDTALPASDWRLGVAGGYAHTSFAIDDYRSSGSSDGADFAAYAGGTLATLGRGTLQVNLGATFGIHDVSVERTIVYAGYSGKASSDFEATTAQAFGELAYDIDVGRTVIGAARVEPFAGLGAISARTASFSETGGVAALDGTAGSFGATTSQIGIRGETRLPVTAASIELGGTIGWQHVFSDPTPSAEFAFAAGGSRFDVFGAPIAGDALLLGVGLDADLSAAARFGLSYLGRVAGDAENHAVNGTLSVRF
jgi:outer membrane autotransporter protein